ncbi:MAG TPA: hypothetical protein VNI57_14130, partial [Candidatus Saccharimonadales bacterium]|nr:hypothetical protein [Candidatus Saccharimonadales bacterium]
LARPWPNHGLLLAVETLLRSAYQPGILDGLFDRSLFDPDRDRITFLNYRRPALELEDLFERFGDMRRVPSKDLPAVNVALRSPDGALLGHAALSGESLGYREDRMTWVHREMGNVILSLAAALLVGTLLLPHRRGGGPDLLRQVVRLAAVWGLRFILLEFPLPASIFRPPLDDPGLFARTDYAGLLRSPLDFLLTSVAVLASGVLVSLMITRSLPQSPSGKRGRAAALLVLALAVAFFLGTRLPDEALKIVQNTRVDILTVEPTSPHAARMALQAAMGFTLTGFVIPLVTLLWAAVWAASPAEGGGPPPPPDPTDRALRWLVLLVLPCAVLAAFVLELAIQPAATSHLQRFLENDLTLYVRWIPLQRRVNLRDALADVADFSGLAERIEAVPPGGDPTLAYELWQSTPLAGRGYAASLTVTDLGGRLVSRFSRNFPDILDARGLEPPNIPEGRITEFTSALRGRRINALHGHIVVRRDGDPVGTVTIHLRDDFGDLPGLSPPTPLQEALGEVRPLTRLLPSWYPRVGVAVYSPQGVTVLSNPRNPPPPPSAPVRAGIMSDFREKHWQVRVEGGVTWYDLFFSSRDHLVALSFPEPGIAGRIARAIRLSAQTLLALLILVAPWGLASGLRLGWRPSPARLVDAL